MLALLGICAFVEVENMLPQLRKQILQLELLRSNPLNKQQLLGR